MNSIFIYREMAFVNHIDLCAENVNKSNPFRANTPGKGMNPLILPAMG